jgi:UDP-2,3-diacylglucosamine pyrophosphatase LpxH
MSRGPATASDQILVISDTHFGEPDAMLQAGDNGTVAARARIEGLMDWLASQGRFREIVLIGDIWELWTATFAEARADSAYFLSCLASLDFDEMIFLPGNHDHHLLVQHQLVEQILAMRDDRDLEVPANTQRRYTDSHLANLLPPEARARFVVSYPDHFSVLGGRHVIFHHGHQMVLLRGGRSIFASVPLFILQRVEEIGLHDITRSDLELGGTIFFELMYAASRGSRTRTKMNQTWERFLALKTRTSNLVSILLRPIQYWISTVARGTPEQDVQSYGAAVSRILALAEEEHGQPLPCDAYVFGHTHRAGIANHVEEGRTRLIVNAGTWLHEPSKANAASEGTFLILDTEHIALYRQGDDLSIRPLDIKAWPEPARVGG